MRSEKTNLNLFNEKLVKLISNGVFFSSGYYDFMKHENDEKRFNFRFRQYMRILERETATKSEEKAIEKVNRLIAKDEMIKHFLKPRVSGESIKIYSQKNKEDWQKEFNSNIFDDYSFEDNKSLMYDYSKEEAVNASFVLL